MSTAIQPPRRSPASFLHSEPVTSMDGLQADIAFLGVPYGQAYSYEELTNDQTNGPTALRAASARIVHGLDRHDFDLGGPLYDGRPVRAVDCGDVRTEIRDPGAHSRYTEQAVRAILAAGAMPIVLGGDHGVPIPVLRAFDTQGPITLIQIDQHIDWRDDIGGVREGLSSPIRRASEMPMRRRSAGVRGVAGTYLQGDCLSHRYSPPSGGVPGAGTMDERRLPGVHRSGCGRAGPAGMAGGGDRGVAGGMMPSRLSGTEQEAAPAPTG